jgi:acetylornithine deacetylase/succinyl-diaminopimelate desuccinylase-like protein
MESFMKKPKLSIIILLLLILLGCNTKIPVRTETQSLDTNKIPNLDQNTKDLVNTLVRYLQINTAQPKPDYNSAVDFFVNMAIKDNLVPHKIMLPSNLPALIIEYPLVDKTSTKPALALNGHMDVVPAQNLDKWEAKPFSGSIIQDSKTQTYKIIARGAQDMKGQSIGQYWALKKLRENNVQLGRPVYMILVPDEEVGGKLGAAQLIENDYFKSLNIKYLIDETPPAKQESPTHIRVSTKKVLWLTVTAKGTQQHGSELKTNNSINKLSEALAAVYKSVKKHQKNGKPAGSTLTANVTSFLSEVEQPGTGQPTINIIPDHAKATIDIRVPPDMTMLSAIKLFDHYLKSKDISYKIVYETIDFAQPSTNDVIKTDFFKSVKNSIEKLGIAAEPFNDEITSDTQHYTRAGIMCLGVNPTFENNLYHRTNEFITTDDLIRIANVQQAIVKNFCK